MLLRLLLLLLLPVFALAQDCDCCKVRDKGYAQFNSGAYADAKSTWQSAKKMPDVAKCTDLDVLVNKAQRRIDESRTAVADKADDNAWETLKGSAEGCKQYLKRYPNGRHVFEARQCKKDADEEAKRKKTDQEADDLAWRYAQGSLYGCKRYLIYYPNGQHATEARQCEKDYSDTDSDGVINKLDRCPSQKGTIAHSGCPPPKPVITPAEKNSPVTHRKKSGLTMVAVEGDTFTMGGTGRNECPHLVKLDNFAIGQYEVTQADWVEVTGVNPSSFNGCDDCPVEQISWIDIQDFLSKANEKYNRHFRLPTEEEWEFAARGGKKTNKYGYAGNHIIDEIAWYEGNSGDHTHSVGTKAANELGLYDMSGNVWEWCQDILLPYPDCSEPKQVDAARRVLRGGSWDLNSLYCRTTYRGTYTDTIRDYSAGFRLVQD